MSKQIVKCKWKAGEIIREIKSGKPFLVLHVYKNISTILSDLEEDMPVAIVLLPKKYEEFATDSDMEQEVKKNEFGDIVQSWNYVPMVEIL